jgi:beta-phosphoglucomutase-like phosphatase (HAD superfamily)
LAPDLFLFAAERMGAKPADCVVIEDSVPGVLGARAAGMRVLAYDAEHNDGDSLIAAGGEPFRHMRELPGLIG